MSLAEYKSVEDSLLGKSSSALVSSKRADVSSRCLVRPTADQIIGFTQMYVAWNRRWKVYHFSSEYFQNPLCLRRKGLVVFVLDHWRGLIRRLHALIGTRCISSRIAAA